MHNKFILGTVQLGMPYGISNSTGQPDEAAGVAILDSAWELGIDTLDTARAYGVSMELIGRYHKTRSHSFKVISKFHADGSDLESKIKSELDLLGIPQFEAYLFHSFRDFETASPETIIVLRSMRTKGLIKKIGVSVYGNEQFEKAVSSELPDLIQFPYNLLDNESLRGSLMAAARAAGKELHVRSVFLQGLFFMQEEKMPLKLKTLAPYLESVRQIAHVAGMSLEELALGYALRNENIQKVLIGVDTVQQLRSNLAAAGKAALLTDRIIHNINNIRVKEIELLSPANWN